MPLSKIKLKKYNYSLLKCYIFSLHFKNFCLSLEYLFVTGISICSHPKYLFVTGISVFFSWNIYSLTEFPFVTGISVRYRNFCFFPEYLFISGISVCYRNFRFFPENMDCYFPTRYFNFA